MGAESIFRIVGGIAGVGGLSIGLFFLVTRAVLKAVPAPKSVTGPKFLRLIDRIILFAFLLAVLGLLVYAVLEMGRRANEAVSKTTELSTQLARLEVQHDALSGEAKLLGQRNDGLQKRIDEVAEAGLKARSSAFEVLTSDVEFDLTGWQQVPTAELRTRKLSVLVTRTRRRVSRAHRETTKFAATYGTTSPFDPVFNCKSHAMTSVPNRDPTPPGKESMRRWILEYDIGHEPLFLPFDIVTETTGWNAHQDPNSGHEGTIILFPTHAASLDVLFPAAKRPKEKSIECYSYPLAEGPRTLEPNPKLTVAESRVRWDIPLPRLGYHYEIHWKW